MSDNLWTYRREAMSIIFGAEKLITVISDLFQPASAFFLWWAKLHFLSAVILPSSLDCSVRMFSYQRHQKTPLNCPRQVGQLQSPGLLLDPWSLLSVGESVNKSAITSLLTPFQCLSLSLTPTSFTWPSLSVVIFLLLPIPTISVFILPNHQD